MTIQIGQEFKNFTELCKAFGVKPAHTTEKKVAQLAKFTQLLELEQTGKRFKVVSIKDAGLLETVGIQPVIDSRGVLLCAALLSLTPIELHEEVSTVQITINTHYLQYFLGLVNENFIRMRYSAKTQTTRQMYAHTNALNDDIVEYLIGKLSSLKLISTLKGYEVQFGTTGGKGVFSGYSAGKVVLKNLGEISEINGIFRKIISDMGGFERNILFLQDRLKEFNTRLRDSLEEQFNILQYEDVVVFSMKPVYLSKHLLQHSANFSEVADFLRHSNIANVSKLRKCFLTMYDTCTDVKRIDNLNKDRDVVDKLTSTEVTIHFSSYEQVEDFLNTYIQTER